MNSKKWTIVGLIVIASLVGLFFLVPAWAQGPNNTTPFTGTNYGPGWMMSQNGNTNFTPGAGRMGGRGMMGGQYAQMADHVPGQMMQNGAGYGPGSMMGAGYGSSQSMIAVLADFLGIDTQTLITELQNASSVAEVITNHGQDVNAFVDVFMANRSERMAVMVESGQLSQEDVDAHLADMEAQMLEHLNSPWTGTGPAEGFGPPEGFGPGMMQGTQFDGQHPCPMQNGAQTGTYGGRMGRWQQAPQQ